MKVIMRMALSNFQKEMYKMKYSIQEDVCFNGIEYFYDGEYTHRVLRRLSVSLNENLQFDFINDSDHFLNNDNNNRVDLVVENLNAALVIAARFSIIGFHIQILRDGLVEPDHFAFKPYKSSILMLEDDVRNQIVLTW